MLTLSERLSAAAPDDWLLWREANRFALETRDPTSKIWTLWIANSAIIDLAQRLNRPDLLIAVAMSWLKPEGIWDIASTGVAWVMPEGDLEEQIVICGCTIPWNALGSAALRAREGTPFNVGPTICHHSRSS